MKKKELKKLTAEQANLVRDMSVLMMRQNPTKICYQRNLELSSQLSELLKDVSDKAENENSDLQMVYSQIISLKAAFMNERRKRKKLEKRVQGMDSKWSKNWEKAEKAQLYGTDYYPYNNLRRKNQRRYIICCIEIAKEEPL